MGWLRAVAIKGVLGLRRLTIKGVLTLGLSRVAVINLQSCRARSRRPRSR